MRDEKRVGDLIRQSARDFPDRRDAAERAAEIWQAVHGGKVNDAASRAAAKCNDAWLVSRKKIGPGTEALAAIIREEYAPLVDFVKSFVLFDCSCDEPEPGESGVIVCDRCRARAALAGEGKP